MRSKRTACRGQFRRDTRRAMFAKSFISRFAHVLSADIHEIEERAREWNDVGQCDIAEGDVFPSSIPLIFEISVSYMTRYPR